MYIIKLITYKSLPSTNQTLYQLALEDPIHFMVVSTFNQTNGKGYVNNKWESTVNQNLTFSFLINRNLTVQRELPVLNMWVAVTIYEVLTNWQVPSKIKWPNDIIVHGKKVGGILIKSKISNNKITFSVIGIGLNIYQTNFENLARATSIKLEKPDFNKPLENCLMEMLYAFEKSFEDFNPLNYKKIIDLYHKNLFKRDEVATYEFDGMTKNGILRGIDDNGNAVIEIEGLGLMTFQHKEVKLNY
ncbi:biotin--[acetyl-CoA-carboxylase] ligase [Flavobacteriaceae bacterium Ap0902]|nr:biotin--[acetyl-CoA-carboxylase] ligase [Flavobacteriaceae bacterium Ap0902]